MQEKVRVAKYIAHAGFCSRRDAEKLISSGSVAVNGKVLESPAVLVSEEDKIEVKGTILKATSSCRVWIYHKPVGLVTTHKDTHARKTVFETLPKNLPRVISVGRLDLNSEGLLILTNSGKLARYFELPKNALGRVYKARAFGNLIPQDLKKIEQGITIDSVAYKPAHIKLLKQESSNSWFEVELYEGKNREIRKIFAHFGLAVNRLIRIKYGPFELGELKAGEIREIPTKDLKQILPEEILRV